MDQLKESTQRLGLKASSFSRKSEEDEKVNKKEEQFEVVTSSAGTKTTEDTEANEEKSRALWDCMVKVLEAFSSSVVFISDSSWSHTHPNAVTVKEHVPQAPP